MKPLSSILDDLGGCQFKFHISFLKEWCVAVTPKVLKLSRKPSLAFPSTVRKILEVEEWTLQLMPKHARKSFKGDFHKLGEILNSLTSKVMTARA